MSRTTNALRRFGVPGLAALTLVAGIPALASVSAANAAAGDTVTITPEADSASVGTCNPFTVTARNQSGGPATSTVDVNIAERTNAGAAATETFDVEFCNEPTGGVTPQLPADQSENESITGNDTDHGEFTVGADGTFTFGIKSVASTSPAGGPTTGVADITAFIDDAQSTSPAVTRNDDVAQGGEAQDTAVKTFSPGGTAQGNSDTPTSAGSANNLVEDVDASPETQNVFAGEVVSFDVLVKNAQQDTLVGVRPAGDVTAGPNNNQPVSCGASNNSGIATCTYQAVATGTDTVVIFVNEINADANANTADTNGLDAGEKSDQVTVNVATAPTGLVVTLTCGDGSTPRTAADACRNPLSDNTEVFTATVTGPDSNDPGTERDVASGVIVNFTQANTANGDASAESLSPTSATTDANGVATTTLTNTTTTEGEVVTVTATVRGQDPAQAGTADTATKTWRTAAANEARFVVLTPESATTTAGTFREYTARVTNAFGEVVGGVEVTFSETGAGAFRNGNSQQVVTTNAAGIARIEVTSGANELGQQTITATISTNTTQCGQAANNPNGAAAGDCDDVSTNNFVAAATQSPSGQPTSPAPGCSVAAQNLPIRINTPFINATGLASVTVTGARAGAVIELQGYSQNHFGTANFNNDATPVDRTVTADQNGTATINDIRPSSNTRLRARERGCAFGAGNLGAVINVRTQLTLIVQRTGVRTYNISGKSIPARPGGLIVSLYLITGQPCAAGVRPADCPGERLIAQTRANSVTGNYSFTRSFGPENQNRRINLVLKTGQDAQNAPGRSNVRNLLVR